MDVVIAGAHGKVGRRLARRLAARGDRVRGLIRDPGQADDVRADGGEPVVCDLEHAGVPEIARAVAGADAVVFAAGAGPGSGPERKWTMDRDGAIKLLEAARGAEVDGYVMLSSVRTESPPDGDDTFSVYLRAKAEADRTLMASDRDWRIVRPGGFTDDPGDDRVRLTLDAHGGEIPRDEVAAVLEAVLHEPRAARRVVYASDGDDPADRALAALLDG